MADLHRNSQTPEGLHAAIASTGTTLREDMDSKTPVPSIGDNYDGLDEKREDKPDEKREETTVDSPVQNEELAEDEYPSGLKMFFIVLALVLSVFLLSLDMVSLYDLDQDIEIEANTCFFCRQSWQPLFPRLPTNSRASTRPAGMVPPSS